MTETSPCRRASAARVRLLGGLLAAACLLPLAAAAPREPMAIDFVGADVESAIKAIGQMTGRNFVIDPRVKGTINIVSGSPVTPEVAYQTLVAALRLQGFAVVEGRNVTRVLPEADARMQSGPVRDPGNGGEQIITRVFQVRYESAPQLVNALKPLIGANQSITANAASNTLLISESADNLRRIERILAAIDVPQANDPQVLTLRHVSALEVARNLQQLFPGGSAGGLAVSTDLRGNRLFLRADNPGLLMRAAGIAATMDKPEAGLGNIRVVHLKHADATRIADTLRALLGGETTNAAAPAAAAPAPGSSTQGKAAEAPATPASALLPGSTIQADAASNSLIITAPEGIFANLQNVIAMLDRRRAQVHIEALIVELSAERAAEFGIQWQDLSGLGEKGVRVIGGTKFGGSGQNIVSAATSIANTGGGLNFGVVNGTINVPGLGTITNLGLLARFLESEVRANILSTPSIMTLDNEEAKIVIGQNLPFVTGAYSTTAGSTSVTPFQTYERRDVGLTLKVKPKITEGGVVHIQIYQEASSVQSGTAGNASGPVTNKRSLESSVLVDDGRLLVLGGLIEDNLGSDEEKVPVLGDVPVLRNLFRYENRSRKKTNLMVFLRPRIVRDERDYDGLTEDRYSQLLDAQKRQQENHPPAWGERDAPRLPEPAAPTGKRP
ncbi:general secretion pathway protein D [Azonexus fungiphilus]|uniref:General secretion pathway protein D n=1 Tax=Azonexus fungiphilus TaxID=146940 RepID=A0A495WMT0_9RHOO|nr:type II secretion system secretin GspD [Azonexus fungiphilus]RKT63022.1 general secretion pathway protein D [Azonexus fungiphilus]